jgi:hypothetical protein
MSETATGEQLLEGVETCLLKFCVVSDLLNTTEPDAVSLSSVRSAWNGYYFGPFAVLDRLLSNDANCGGFRYRALMPVSINSHNLHRLFEVLDVNVGDGVLGGCRVPERVNDLYQHCSILKELLEERCIKQNAVASEEIQDQ